MDQDASIQDRSVEGAFQESQRTKEPQNSVNFRTIFDNELGYVLTSLHRMGVADRDREDLANEVFFRVHGRLGDYDPSRPMRPWLFAFVVRVASDYRRATRHRIEVMGESLDVASTGSTPHEEIARAESHALVLAALETLDTEKRAVFVLHDLDENPIPEVARALGIPEGTAYSRLRAAREQFTIAVRKTQTQRRGS